MAESNTRRMRSGTRILKNKVDITKIATFIRCSPNPTWLATRQGRCVYANPALQRLTGLNLDQISQADWSDFLLEDDRTAATASWQRSLASGTSYRMHVHMREFDGVPKTVELIAFSGTKLVMGHNSGCLPDYT